VYKLVILQHGNKLLLAELLTCPCSLCLDTNGTFH